MESRKYVHGKGEKGARDLMICCQTCGASKWMAVNVPM